MTTSPSGVALFDRMRTANFYEWRETHLLGFAEDMAMPMAFP